MARAAGVLRTDRRTGRPLFAGVRRSLRLLRTPPNRRAAGRRVAAASVALAAMTVATATHRHGLELADRWGATTTVLVLDSPVASGDPVLDHARAVEAPVELVPDGHLEALPADARAAIDLGENEILTRRRVRVGGDRGTTGPGRHRALVPVPLHGRDGAAPAELAVDDVVDVIAPGAPTAAGGRGPARSVAAGALVRSVDAAAVTLEVATSDVAELADALLGGPVVLTVVGSAGGDSGPGGGDVVDDE